MDFTAFDDTSGDSSSTPSAPASKGDAIDPSYANSWWQGIHSAGNTFGSSQYPTDPAGFTPQDWQAPTFTQTGGGQSFDMSYTDPNLPANGGSVDYWTPGGTPDFATLQSLGYKGRNPNEDQWLNDGRQQEYEDFLKQLNSQGTTFMNRRANYDLTGKDGYSVMARDSSGKAIGTPSWVDTHDNEDAFQAIMMAAGGAIGGFGAGEALEAAGYGGLATDATGATVSNGAAGGGYGGAGYGTAAGTNLATQAGGAAGSAFGSTLASTGDLGQAFKSGVYGGVTGGATSFIDPAGSLGIENETLGRGVNKAAGAGFGAALHGQNVGQAVLGSGLQSGLGAGLSAGYNGAKTMFGGDSQLPEVDDYSNGFGGGYGASPSPASDSSARNALGLNFSRPADNTSSLSSWMGTPQVQNASMISPDNNQLSVDPYAGMNTSGAEANNQVKQSFMARAQKQSTPNGGSPDLRASNFDSMAGNLMGLYSAYKAKRGLGREARQLQDLYSTNSPYAQQMRETLMRQDAAAGRRSQVGPRSVELAARLADVNSRNAPMLNKINGQQGAAGDMMLNNLFRLGTNPMVRQQAGNWWQQGVNGLGLGGGPVGANPNSDYNYQNGSDLGYPVGG